MAKVEQCACQVRFPVNEWVAFRDKCKAAKVSINQALICLARLVVRGDVVMQPIGVQADLMARRESSLTVPPRKKMLRVRPHVDSPEVEPQRVQPPSPGNLP